MDWKPFWKIIEESYRPDAIDHFEALKEHLHTLKWFEVVEFQARFDEAVAEANNLDLWGAAYLINGGCSDDGFDYFRDWLLLQGRKVYEAALKNPDSLADVVDPDEGEYECGCMPGMHAWFRATDNEDGYDDYDVAYSAKYPETPRMPSLGGRWDHDSDKQMRRRLPRLWALYNDLREEE